MTVIQFIAWWAWGIVCIVLGWRGRVILIENRDRDNRPPSDRHT